jgi:RHS repeat-associated protein
VLSAYGAITSGNYKSEADFNRDGVVNASDLAAVLAYAAALPEGTLSSPAIDNRTGYCGYRFAPEPEMYLARNRWLSPPLGRWIQRDPLGYVDGLNLGEYANSSPLVSNDPYGEEMHHLVPVQSIKDLLGRGLLDPELGREMKRYGDSRWTINAPSHRGSHPEYTKAVNGIIEAYVRRNGGRPLTRGDMERIQRLILQSNDEEIVKHFRKWGVRVTVRVISGDISMLSRLGGSAGSAAGGGAFLYGAYAAAMLYLAGEAAGAGIEMVGHYATCCSCLAEKDTAPKTRMSLSGITVDFWTVSHSGIGEVLCMEERGGSSKLLVGYEAPGILWGKEEFRWRPCERGGR